MFDMINNVQIILAICTVFLLVGMRQRRGMAVFDVIVVVLLLCLARVLYDEALKRPVSARPKEGIKRRGGSNTSIAVSDSVKIISNNS